MKKIKIKKDLCQDKVRRNRKAMGKNSIVKKLEKAFCVKLAIKTPNHSKGLFALGSR